MPFGKYDPLLCENPECRKKFVPETPWQRHCCEDCRNHCTYMRVTLPKRIKKYEKAILTLSGDPRKKTRLKHTQERVARWRQRVKLFMGAVKPSG